MEGGGAEKEEHTRTRTQRLRLLHARLMANHLREEEGRIMAQGSEQAGVGAVECHVVLGKTDIRYGSALHLGVGTERRQVASGFSASASATVSHSKITSSRSHARSLALFLVERWQRQLIRKE